MAASSIVQVVNADVGDIVLNIVQNQAVSGQVHSDVPIPAGARLQVRLVPATPALGMQFAGAQVNPDGSFRFEATSFRSGPGEYRVSMNPSVGTSGMPASWYLKEAKLDDTEAMNNPVRLPAQATLNLFVSSRGGQVGGVLRNAQGQPVPRMYAVLIPEGWSRQDQIRQVLTDPTGRFSFPNLAPGNYKLFAWEDVESGSWFDPEWVKDWEEKGTTVRLAEGGKEEIDLKTIPPGDPQ
jgi:hypothetical protein